MEILLAYGIRWLNKYSRIFAAVGRMIRRLAEVAPLLPVKLLNARDCG